MPERRDRCSGRGQCPRANASNPPLVSALRPFSGMFIRAAMSSSHNTDWCNASISDWTCSKSSRTIAQAEQKGTDLSKIVDQSGGEGAENQVFLCLGELLAHHARTAPDHEALLAPDVPPVTYGELWSADRRHNSAIATAWHRPGRQDGSDFAARRRDGDGDHRGHHGCGLRSPQSRPYRRRAAALFQRSEDSGAVDTGRHEFGEPERCPLARHRRHRFVAKASRRARRLRPCRINGRYGPARAIWRPPRATHSFY